MKEEFELKVQVGVGSPKNSLATIYISIKGGHTLCGNSFGKSAVIPKQSLPIAFLFPYQRKLPKRIGSKHLSILKISL